MSYRVRIAPSPTGFMHIGTLRTILYNYFLAKKNNGKFVCRVEDTDQDRFVEGAIDAIYDSIKWVGIKFDEGPKEGGNFGPYVQSQRKERHLEIAEELIKKGHAYKCFCSKERLDELRSFQEKMGKPTGYDGKCRELTENEVNEKIKSGEKYVIRMKIPKNTIIKFKDEVRGELEFDSNTLDDHVIFKSDGLATAQLAIPLDDHDMKISQVIRGEEWLPSTPRQVLLFDFMGWERPKYAHLSNILRADGSGKKLSKRDGGAFVSDYIEKGFLPEATISYIPMLGWNPGTPQDLFTMDELIEQFSLDKVQKSGSVFDITKFEWVNGNFIRNLSIEELTNRLMPFVEKQEFYKPIPKEKLEEIVKELQPRMKTLLEGAQNTRWYFILENYESNLFLHEKMNVDKEKAKKSLEISLNTLNQTENWDLETIKANLSEEITKNSLKNGELLWPLRVALTGLPFSPGAYEIANILGKEETIKRIEIGLKKLV